MFVVKPFWEIIFQCIRKVNKYTILGTKYGNRFLVLHIMSRKMDKKCEIGLYHVKLDRVTYNRNFFAKKVKNTQTYRTALLKNSFNWHVTPNLFLSPAWKKIHSMQTAFMQFVIFCPLVQKGTILQDLPSNKLQMNNWKMSLSRRSKWGT